MSCKEILVFSTFYVALKALCQQSLPITWRRRPGWARPTGAPSASSATRPPRQGPREAPTGSSAGPRQPPAPPRDCRTSRPAGYSSSGWFPAASQVLLQKFWGTRCLSSSHIRRASSAPTSPGRPPAGPAISGCVLDACIYSH